MQAADLESVEAPALVEDPANCSAARGLGMVKEKVIHGATAESVHDALGVEDDVVGAAAAGDDLVLLERACIRDDRP